MYSKFSKTILLFELLQTILDLFAAPLDAKNDALNTSDIVLQGLDELLPSTGAGYSSPSATGISEQSLVASSVFGGKAGEESTPTETSTDPKEEFPSVASDDIYQEFVSKLMLHECKVLVDEIRKFLESILGPFGDGQPPDPDMTVHPHGTPIVPFYGSKDIAARCTKFFDMMTETFKAHRLWKGLCIKNGFFPKYLSSFFDDLFLQMRAKRD